MKDVVLEEKIDKIITEELGVANEVTKLAGIIEKKVFELLKSGVYEKVFNVKTELSDVNVDYVFRDFMSPGEAKKYLMFDRSMTDGYSYQTNTIYLNLISINGNLNMYDFADTIQHECSHYWETKNMGKDTYNERYQNIVDGMNSRNPVVELICSIVYYCDKNEINAFVNGSYASAMKKKVEYKTYKEFVEDNFVSEIYNTLKNAGRMVEEASKQRSAEFFMAEFWLSTHGIFNCEMDEIKGTVIKLAEKSFNYLIRQIGKAYSLYKEKYEEYQENMERNKISNIFRKAGLKNGDV